MPKFKVGDRVRLQRVTVSYVLARISNDCFFIFEEEFDREHAVHEVLRRGRYFGDNAYKIPRNDTRTGQTWTGQTWTVLECMLVAVGAVGSSKYRVQCGSYTGTRYADPSWSVEELVRNVVGSGSWEGVGKATESFIRGELKGTPFTLMRID